MFSVLNPSSVHSKSVNDNISDDVPLRVISNIVLKDQVMRKTKNRFRNFGRVWVKLQIVLQDDGLLFIYQSENHFNKHVNKPKYYLDLNSSLIKESNDTSYPYQLTIIKLENGSLSDSFEIIDLQTEDRYKLWNENLHKFLVEIKDDQMKQQIDNFSLTRTNPVVNQSVQETSIENEPETESRNIEYNEINHMSYQSDIKLYENTCINIQNTFYQNSNIQEDIQFVTKDYVSYSSIDDKNCLVKYEFKLNNIENYYQLFSDVENIKILEPNLRIFNVNGSIKTQIKLQFTNTIYNKTYNGQRIIFYQIQENSGSQITQILDVVENIYSRCISYENSTDKDTRISIHIICHSQFEKFIKQSTSSLIKSNKLLTSIYDNFIGSKRQFNEDFLNILDKNKDLIKQIDHDHEKESSEIEKLVNNVNEEYVVDAHNLSITYSKKFTSIEDIFKEKFEKQGGHQFKDNLGYLYYTNQKLMNVQRDVQKTLLKKMGSNLASGKGVMNISFPVGIFSHDSLLMKIAKEMRQLPQVIRDLKESSDSIMNMAIFTSWQIIVNMICLEQKKPFNPIWGETYRCRIDDLTVELEQTLHSPPVSSFYITSVNKSIKIQGYKAITATIGMNSGRTGDCGKIWQEDEKNKFCISECPSMVLNNFLMGKRQIVFEGRLVIDNHHGLLSIIYFDPDCAGGAWFSGAKADKIIGQILKLDENDKIATILQEKKQKGIETLYGNKIIARLDGFWTEKIQLNQNHETIELIDAEKKLEQLQIIHNMEGVRLPSDSCNRKDIEQWINEDMANAEAMKLDQEERQRTEKNLRKDHCQFKENNNE